MKLPRTAALKILYDTPEMIVLDEITDHSRWSIHHRIVVRINGRLFESHYSVGATEYQDESPWEYDNEVEFTEVIPKEVTIIKYVPVEVNA
jgi:hypothetical protein